MFQYLSNLILKVDLDFPDTTSWGKLFQILITLELKKCCLTVVLTLGLNNLDVCPLVVLPDALVKILSALIGYWLLMILYYILQLNHFFVVCNIRSVIVIGLI